MAGRNGKSTLNGPMVFETDQMNPEDYEIKADKDRQNTPAAAGFDFSKAALAMFPLTPLPFKGKGAGWAYARIGLYGIAGYLSFSRARKLSYFMFGAAATSALVSTTTTAWQKGENK